MAEVVFDQNALVLDFLGAPEVPLVVTWLVEANPLPFEKPYPAFDVKASIFNPNDEVARMRNIRVVTSNPDTLADAQHGTTLEIAAGGTQTLTITLTPASGLGKGTVSIRLAAAKVE